MIEKYGVLPNGVSLPRPNNDPDYVPTPPKPILARISPRGTSEIKFNEPVFEYPDLKNKMTPKPPEISQGRLLQQIVEIDGVNVELIQFIEVYVEPGEESDPSKLTFEYDLAFKDDTTISLSIFWDNPPFVSANQPEDVLVIKFNGPFYDVQDGLDVEVKNKIIRRTIPPQLELSTTTDIISGAGDGLQIVSLGSVVANFVLNIFLAGSLN